jgi:hypothetical protein
VPALVILAAGRGRRFGGAKQLAPVGRHGEAILDYLAHDARRAGFARVVLVCGGATAQGVAARAGAWPDGAGVSVAAQPGPRETAREMGLDLALVEGRRAPLGTAAAVLAAREQLGGESGFAVVNADDLYGLEPLALLCRHLEGAGEEHAVVAYRLESTMDGVGPVSRAICRTDGDRLVSIVESSVVSTGGAYEYEAGPAPAAPATRVSGATRVSMNAWGFRPPVLRKIEAELRQFLQGGHGKSEAELTLPGVVDAMVRSGSEVRVLETGTSCVGLTHPGDIERVRERVAALVAAGEYPEPLWARR